MNDREHGAPSSGNSAVPSAGDRTRSMPVPVPRTRPVAQPRNQGKATTLVPDIQVSDMSSTLPGSSPKPSLPPKPRREPPEPPGSTVAKVDQAKETNIRKPVTTRKPIIAKKFGEVNRISNNNDDSEALQNEVVNGTRTQNVDRIQSRKSCSDVASDSDEETPVANGRKTSLPDNLDTSGRNRPRPSPPKKPLPQLPKKTPQNSHSPKKDSSPQPSKRPPIPSKPPPSRSSPPKSDAPIQPSVAALASKLAAVPVFPLKPCEDSRRGGVSPTSPHLSPRPSPGTSPRRPSPKGSPLLLPKTGQPAQNKENGIENKPSVVKPKPSAKPAKMESPKDSVSRKPPCRPSPPSVDVLVRKRSGTAETLEEGGLAVKPAKPDGAPRKYSNPDTGQKKRLAHRGRSLAQNPAKISGLEFSQRRLPPPLPAEPSQLQRRLTQNVPPPIPDCPRPRPYSAIIQSSTRQPLQNNKSISIGDISNIPDEAEYSYAYQHTLVGLPQSQKSLPEGIADNEYAQPEAETVAGFVDSLNQKVDHQDEGGVYEDVDSIHTTPSAHQPSDTPSDDSFSDSSDDPHEYTFPADSGTAAADSSDSDDSHDYEMPPEERAREGSGNSTGYFEPIHKSPSDSGSSDDEQEEVMQEDPLYQVYVSRTLRRERNLSRRTSSSSSTSADMSLDELTKGTLRNMRMLWCELPEVKACGILDTMKSDERKRQEAMFEVITSEASYLKSLNILVSHFMKSAELAPGSPQCVLERGQYHVLFSNVGAIKDTSERFLQCLRDRQREGLVISTISDIIEEHASKYFDVYVKYCSNQIYQDRTIKSIRCKNNRFLEALNKLESSQDAQGLTLQSFLVLPMQRITRLPLLVDAICHRCEPGGKDYLETDKALSAINKVVHDCNEGARKMERMEEMFILQGQIEFKTKPIALATSTRYLLRRGELSHLQEDNRTTLRKGRSKFKPIYLFLFSDLVLLAKKKSDNRFQVMDHATRSMSQLDEGGGSELSCHAFSLILLENSDGKTKDFVLACESETDKTRWIEAFKPPTGAKDGETVYEPWDCPQVQAIHKYVAQQPDELTLHNGDVINVLRKLPDGWYHGERLCDAVQGWFPANHTEEIRNEHVRARNLLQRYRLLAASQHLIGMTLKR